MGWLIIAFYICHTVFCTVIFHQYNLYFLFILWLLAARHQILPEPILIRISGVLSHSPDANLKRNSQDMRLQNTNLNLRSHFTVSLRYFVFRRTVWKQIPNQRRLSLLAHICVTQYRSILSEQNISGKCKNKYKFTCRNKCHVSSYRSNQWRCSLGSWSYFYRSNQSKFFCFEFKFRNFLNAIDFLWPI